VTRRTFTLFAAGFVGLVFYAAHNAHTLDPADSIDWRQQYLAQHPYTQRELEVQDHFEKCDMLNSWAARANMGPETIADGKVMYGCHGDDRDDPLEWEREQMWKRVDDGAAQMKADYRADAGRGGAR
jgi:hypothetical protein